MVFPKTSCLKKEIGSFDSNLIVSLTNYYWLGLDRSDPNSNALGPRLDISIVFVSHFAF